jgi:transcriptional regulator with XRE-family HTH domain
MAISAHFEDVKGSSVNPRQPRRKLQLEARGALPSGTEPRILIHDLSATGLLIESPVGLAVDERIAVELPQVGATWAKVVWNSGMLYGCQFDVPISNAALSAAQLRSAVGQQVEIAPPRAAAAEASLGSRLEQLRRKRGITLAYIAAQLGVSKPTVWAWEHDKARPTESRIEALAAVLGVESKELVASASTSDLEALLVRSRVQIAAAVGTSPDNVKIWLEL